MAQLAIKGHPTRGKEVIEILEMLGGKNKQGYSGEYNSLWHYIDVCSEIRVFRHSFDDYIFFTLEEFLEEFPYKVGDKVLVLANTNYVFKIKSMTWNTDLEKVSYRIEAIDDIENEFDWYADELIYYSEQKEETADKTNKAVFDANAQCCDIMNHLIKEETMEELIKIDIPAGYEFAGIDDDNQQVVFEKIGCQYPKTYKECCKVLELTNLELPTAFGYKSIEIESLQQLLVCRNAYWKIAGEQLRLNKPWKPDWVKEGKKYCIFVEYNKIVTGAISFGNFFLAFPTEEMRNVFYENFKDLVEICKEFL